MRIEFFNPARICASGQIFRMYPISNGVFDVYSADRRVRLSVTEHADTDTDTETDTLSIKVDKCQN